MARYNYVYILNSLYLLYIMTGCNTGSIDNVVISDSLKNECIQKLRKVMHMQSQFVKVHAAEYLIWSGHPEGVLETFIKEEKLFDTMAAYRIGIWRVLAQAQGEATEKKKWIRKIMEVYKNTNAPDRVHAAETLAKLGVSPLVKYPEITREAIESKNTPLSLYSLWAASLSGKDSMEACRHKVIQLIDSPLQEDTLKSTLAAYILHHIGGLNSGEWRSLATIALTEPVSSLPKVHLLCAAFLTAPEKSRYSKTYGQIKKALIMEQNSHRKGNRVQMALALSKKGRKDDLSVLLSLLNNAHPLKTAADNADVGAAAAYAILKIDSRY